MGHKRPAAILRDARKSALLRMTDHTAAPATLRDIAATFSGFIVAYVLREGGVSGVFGLITSAMIVVIVVIAAFGPDVRGKPLDA